MNSGAVNAHRAEVSAERGLRDAPAPAQMLQVRERSAADGGAPVAMNFEASGFFALRTPLLPFDEFLRWSSELESSKALAAPADLERAIANDRARLRARLLEIYRHPEVREALFVASPNLDESFAIWEKDPESERSEGIELALVRYFSRMAARPTPFGLCAGCSVGKVGAHTRLSLPEQASYRRCTRLDMDYLQGLCEAALREPELRFSFSYRPNSSLYRAADRVHYLESRLKEKVRTYHLVAVEESEALDQILAHAAPGAHFAELAAALVDKEVSRAEAEEYLGELIASQILIPEAALRITGPGSLSSLIEQLAESQAAEPIAQTLRAVGAELAALDEKKLGNAPESYRAVAQRLESLPGKVEMPRLFQVDMVKPAPEATLSNAVLGEIARGVQVLHRLSSPRRNARDELERFREAFALRYEQREVPLTEALDAEVGLGFPISSGVGADASPLLHGLEFTAESDETAPWGEREKFLLRKLTQAIENKGDEIVLQADDLEKLCSKDPLPLPDAFSVTASLSAASDEALTRGKFRVHLQGATGPSGARFLGRFCHADETLHREVQAHLAAEEALRPDAIFAEIVHLPEGRTGNVLARPVLRGHEIPYLGNGGAGQECQIPVTDLRVSVRGERIVLRSARLGCEIIPRLTSAHNFVGLSVGVYRFLSLLQGQAVTGQLSWSWGALESAPFLPRVSLGKLVLSRARWFLHKDEIKRLADERGAGRYRAVAAWRQARRLPRIALLADGDNELPIDFENALSIEALVSLVKQRDGASLVEMFPSSDELCAYGPEGRFVHELIVPFVRKPQKVEPREAKAPLTIHSSPFTAARTFPPGSEWLYAKLFTGTTSADYLLRAFVAPLVEELLGTGAADQWFFIRYGDPDWHLRLRFHGHPERLHSDLLPVLQRRVAPLLRERRIWRLQFDTYEPELERYGGPVGVTLAEKIFQIDSEAVLEILERLEPGDAGLDERWRLALRGIDLLLDDLQLGAETKLAVLRKVRTSFAREHRAETKLKKQIGERFRKERKDLEALLDATKESESALAAGLEILHRRSERLAPIMEELRACASANHLATTLEELAASYIHMHANRMLRSEQRAHELVLYEFLVRLYTPRSLPARL